MGFIVLLAVSGSFALSLCASWFVRRWSLRVGFVDSPGGHKRHSRPVALGGGMAIVVGVLVPVAAGLVLTYHWQRTEAPTWLPAFARAHLAGITSKLPLLLLVLAPAVGLHIVGLVDDRRALGPLVKLTAQLAAALWVATVAGVRAAEVLPVPISVAVTVLWIVLITNAFNFLDNMDGLSAGVAMIAAAIFAVASTAIGQIFVPMLAWVLVGALGGFLVFNFSPASIFMGDSGSLVVGYLIGVITILATFYDPGQALAPVGVLVPVVVLAVPLYDVLSVVMYRLKLGESPFRGDWRHFSHRLVRKGMSRRGAVLTIYLATAATGLPAIALARVGAAMAILLLIQCLCVVAMIAILEHAGGKEVENPTQEVGPPGREAPP